ncbi:O-methyltransferase [Rickettsiales bacterium]|nr:O-methyltransferase [Rickettsiales bacterium]
MLADYPMSCKEEAYIKELFSAQDFVCSEVRTLLPDASGLDAQLDTINARLINIIIQLIRPKRAVELGTLFGYSAIWIARALPSDGVLYTIDKNSKNLEIASKLFRSFGLQDKIHPIHGNAPEELTKLDGLFDIMFIDADKKNYCKYLDWAEANIKKGGLIISDNTLSFGKVNIAQRPADRYLGPWNAVREFNARLADSTKYSSVMLPIAKGLTLALKKF